jgi:hypothetical protein
VAKRKKPGAGTAKPGNVTPFPGSTAGPGMDFQSEKEQMLRLIQEKLSSSDMSSDGMNDFLSGFTGKKMEDIIGELGGGTQSALDRAQDILFDLPEDASDSALKKAAKKALAISEDCMGAWLILSQLAKTHAEAAGFVMQGIDRGRKLHAGLIASVGKDHGLWGHVEARDFMRLLHELAIVMEESADIEGAVDTCHEMIRLNPGDNQGVRGDLLHYLIVLNRPAEVKALLKRFRACLEFDTNLAYGKVLFEITGAIAKLKDGWSDALANQQPSDEAGFRKFLGSSFPAVDKAIKAAMKANPYVGLLMGMPGIMETEPPAMLSVGGPDEALQYIQRQGHIWILAYLPFVMLGTYVTSGSAKANPTQSQRRELENIIEVAARPGCRPWWEVILEETGED